MTNERISLKEAYDNRDVIIQLAILRDKLDSIPDADLTNVVLKTGDQIIDGKKTFNEQMTVNGKIIANDQIVANGGVLFANNGLTVNGTLQVDGDIIQNGSAYDTHAEQVYTTNDLIVTRDGAVGGIAAGQLSGIRVKKYNGVDDLNLGVDNLGVMRVGDLGDEQPLATRDEASAMTSGALVKWDGVNKKMIAPASNVGNNNKPLKEVGGELVAVDNDLVDVTSGQNIDGQKNFLQPLRLLLSGLGSVRLYPSVGTNVNEAVVEVAASNGDFAKIILQYNTSTHVAQILLQKRVSGTMSTSIIATL